MTDGNSEIMMAVKSGRAIRFPESKVRPTGRGAIGVTGIEVDEKNDEVIGMMKERPSLKERASTSERIIGKIYDFVETFISGIAS